MSKVDPFEPYWKSCVTGAMGHYFDMVEDGYPEEALRLHRERFADMARGGPGEVGWYSQYDDHTLTESSYREREFGGEDEWPDAFFQEVCILMHWSEY